MRTSKIISVLGGLGVAALLIPAGVFAATISDSLFSNGDVTIDAAGNSTVNGTFTLQVAMGETCEVIRTQAAPQAFTDTSVGGNLGKEFGTYTNMPFSVKVSPNTGTYYPTIQCAGISGGNRSVDGADNVVVSGNLGTIRVVASGVLSNGNPAPVQQDQWSQISLSLDGILKILAAMQAKQDTSSKPACPPFYTGDNASSVQTWLMANGQSGPFSAVGVYSATGFWGNASKTAYQNALNACK